MKLADMRKISITDHKKKKKPTRGGKTILYGFATPSRIFVLAFKLKKLRKKIWSIFIFSGEEVFEITLFYGTDTDPGGQLITDSAG